jgi:transcriptional regulator with XRE-family HTH domain
VSADVATVGVRVRALRDRIGITQTELADAADVNRGTLSVLESGQGEHGVTVKTLTRLADALDVPVGVLLGERPMPLHWPIGDVFWRQIRREVEQIQGVTS